MITGNDVLKQAYFAGLGGWVKLEHRCGASLLGDMVLVGHWILEQLLEAAWWSAPFLKSWHGLSSGQPSKLDGLAALLKNVLDSIEALKPPDCYSPISVVRVCLQPRIIEQVAQLVMRFGRWAQCLHLVNQLDHIVLIKFKLFRIEQ